MPTASDTVIVFDLEWTSWPGFRESGWKMPGKHREVVQIGAVRLGPGYAEAGFFEALVRPRRSPRLSAYITELTGITQDQVERHGLTFADALAAFCGFIGAATVARGAGLAAWGTDGEVIAENCALSGLPCPAVFTSVINLRLSLWPALGLPGEAVDSGALAECLDLGADDPPARGKAHDALYDARSVGAAWRHLERQRRA